jgi:hypothetical protein
MRENANGYIYRSQLVNSNYSTVERLTNVINSSYGAWDPFIAPDESYMIFSTIRAGGYGQEDQYISYNVNGTWSSPRNLGSAINTTQIEYGSYISPDNKYYFFSRPAGWGPNIAADIYWVDARALDLFPMLAISLNATNVNLSWSTNFPACTLESVAQLSGTWTPVSGVTGYSATLPANAGSQFFRLRK